MNKEKIVIIGAGGHTRSLLTLIDPDKYDIYGIYDDSFSSINQEVISSVPVRGKIKDIPEGYSMVIASGNLDVKKAFLSSFPHRLTDSNFIHSSAIIEKNVLLGNRNQFFAGTIVNAYSQIGDDNIINSGAIIEHEAQIGDHNHISVGTVLCGRTKIGNHCFIGASAVIIDGIKLGNDIIIGANSVVIKNILEPGTYVGSPAKKIK